MVEDTIVEYNGFLNHGLYKNIYFPLIYLNKVATKN